MATGTLVLGAGTIYDADISSLAAIDRTKMAPRLNARIPIPLTAWRIWDAMNNILGATPTTDDDLAIVTGTFGTSPSYIGTTDVKAASKTRYARALVPVPLDFPGNSKSILISAFAGMKTTIADTSATLLFEAYRIARDGTLDAAGNLVTTAAANINNLTASEKQFNLTNAVIQAGDSIDVRVKIATVDAASVTAVIAAIWDINLVVYIL